MSSFLSGALGPASALRLGRLNHVAMAVPNLAEAAAQWKMFGANVSEPVPLPDHGVTTIFVELSNT